MANEIENLVGRTFWDMSYSTFKSPWLLVIFIIIFVILLLLIVKGVLVVRINSSIIEIKTVPLTGIRSDGPYFEVIRSESDNEIKQVFVPTFASTIEGIRPPSESQLEGITQKFALKLSSIYDCHDLKLSPDQTMDISKAIESAKQLVNDRTFGILMGSLNAFEDESPAQGQKAIISITFALYDNSGKKVWLASQTMSGTTAKSGRHEHQEYSGSRLEAIELIERTSTELVLRLKEIKKKSR